MSIQGALRHLKDVRNPDPQSHADSEELEENRAYDTGRQLDVLFAFDGWIVVGSGV